jgi:hypothetical protein
VSILYPGPIVVERKTLLKYIPFEEAGFNLLSSFIKESKFSLS